MRRKECCRGLTYIELLIVIAVLVTLSGIAIPIYRDTIDKARNVRAIGEIRNHEKEIVLYELNNGNLPTTLNQAVRGNILDPWGNPYQYLNIASGGRGIMARVRKDRFLVPLNSTFDLYSGGKDGRSRPALTARDSWDDIVRANDGEYVGLASTY